MKRLAVACLAAVMACGAAWSAADAQQNNGRHYGWRDRGQYANQCGGAQYGRHHARHRNDNDNDNDGDRDDRNDNAQYGNYGVQYGQNGQYGGQYGGRYGQYGACNGQYGGNAVIQGQIVAVNGNQVTIRQNGGYTNDGYNNGGYGQTITVNDQPALDNQTSGRVSTGRYVVAYGYWQNGVFYATRMN